MTARLVMAQTLIDNRQTNRRIKLHAVHLSPLAITDKGTTGCGWCRHLPVTWRARCLVFLAGLQLRRLVDRAADLVKRPDGIVHEVPAHVSVWSWVISPLRPAQQLQPSRQ